MAPDEETTVTRRPKAFAAAPALMKSRHWSTDILKSGLVDSLTELVKIGASQINGCAFCCGANCERERSALAWTEALTPGSRPRGDVYRAVQAHLTEQEQVTLSLLIVAINEWKRIQAGVRAVHPARQREAA
jgi:alkylhydroperoxidase family enzyme